MKAIKCKVCSEEFPKYKCPQCKIEYCSVKCYRNHKDRCSVAIPQSPATTPHSKNPHEKFDEIVPEDEEGDRLTPDLLEKLKDSNYLIEMLKNPHLRGLVTNLDSSEDNGEVLAKLMKEPIFVDFADECLRCTGQQ